MEFLLAETTWRPTFGNLGPGSWCIVLSHFVAGCLCFSAVRRQRATPNASADIWAKRFWCVLAALMFLMCLYKLFDLQSLLTQTGRSIAKRDGWYAQRRPFQTEFVLGCALVGLSAIMASFYVVRQRWRQCGLSYLGAVFLVALVAIRGASFHHIDILLYKLPGIGNWMNVGLELAGSLLVALGAFLVTRNAATTSQAV